MVKLSLHNPGKFAHSIDFPEKWDELSTNEIEIVATHLLAPYNNGSINKAHIFVGLVESCCKKARIKLPEDWTLKLNYEDAATAGFDAIYFLFEENDRTINPYPTLKIGRKTFTGPENDFNYITCAELEDSETFFQKFNETADPHHLARIASILWRPAGEIYNEFESEKSTALFQKLTAIQLFSIYIWYTGCQKMLTKYFPDVYAKGDESSEPDPAAFTKCIHAGAGPKNGTRDNIRAMRAKEFLFDMQLEAETAKKIAAQYDR